MGVSGGTSSGVGAFLHRAESRLLDLSIDAQQADWVYATFITPDSEAVASRAYARLIGETVSLAKDSTLYPAARSSPEEARKIKLLRLALPLIAPTDPGESQELTRLVASMQSTYSKGRHTPVGGSTSVDLQGLSRLLTESRDPVVLEDVWTGWHRVGRAIRPGFTRYVELANRGARELGFDDTGAMWRSKYDMPPDDFAAEVERLWRQLDPLYRSLHAYVRRRLRDTYGEERVPESGPIPATLLGNMWAQSWEGIYPILAPPGETSHFDLTKALVERGTTPEQMVKYGEGFFTSLGLDRKSVV